MLRVCPIIFLALMVLTTACATSQRVVEKTMLSGPVHSKIIALEPELTRFSGKGPFFVTEKIGRELSVDIDNTMVIDHFYAESPDKLPVVLITHGNYSSRNAHNAQARLLASWGFHVVVSDLPNRNQWLENSKRLKNLAELLYRLPGVLGPNADNSRMILVGHSFGGSASIVAASRGAPVMGVVLLDPALVHKQVINDMKSLDLPVVLLGADKSVFTSRGRDRFWKNIGGEIVEISVPSATHDDAQGPSMFARSALGVDPFTSKGNQKIFRSVLTVAVLGIATSGTLDFPFSIFEREEQSGVLTDVKFRSKLSASTE